MEQVILVECFLAENFRLSSEPPQGWCCYNEVLFMNISSESGLIIKKFEPP